MHTCESDQAGASTRACGMRPTILWLGVARVRATNEGPDASAQRYGVVPGNLSR